jgi:uncharacterized protein (TIGR04222 family)
MSEISIPVSGAFYGMAVLCIAMPYILMRAVSSLFSHLMEKLKRDFEEKDSHIISPGGLDSLSLTEVSYLLSGPRGLLETSVYNLRKAGHLLVDVHSITDHDGCSRTLRAEPSSEQLMDLAARESTLEPFEIRVFSFFQKNPGSRFDELERCSRDWSELYNAFREKAEKKYLASGAIYDRERQQRFTKRTMPLRSGRKAVMLLLTAAIIAISALVPSMVRLSRQETAPWMLIVVPCVAAASVHACSSLFRQKRSPEFIVSSNARSYIDENLNLMCTIREEIPEMVRSLMEEPSPRGRSGC